MRNVLPACSTTRFCENPSTPVSIFFFKQKTAYEMRTRLEFRRVLFRSRAVDVDERRVPTRLRTLDQAVDECRLEPRRHDDDVERERSGIAVACEQPLRRVDRVGFGSGEQLERAPPVPLGLDALDHDAGT